MSPASSALIHPFAGSSQDKAVARKTVTAANPAAGAEVSITVPSGKYWTIETVKFALVTSATVANRLPALSIDDGTTEFWRWRSTVAQTATLTWTYYFLASTDNEVNRSAVNEMYEPLPAGLILGPGFRILTTTAAIQVGDDYGAPVLYVTEFG